MSSFLTRFKEHKIISLLALICVIVLVSIIIYFILKPKHEIKVALVGENEVTITIGDNYNELGFTFKDNDLEVPLDKLKVITDDNIDYNTLGEYKLKYKITYLNKEYDLVRNVRIIDDVAPLISVDVDNIEKDYCTKKVLKEYTYSAIDNYDGDVTNSVTKEDLGDKLVLKVVDASGNEAIKEIAIKYSDKPASELKLNGNKTVYVAINTAYEDAGATYTDGCKTENIENLVKEGNVDTTILGEYEIKYSTSSKDKSVSRKVIVYNPSEIKDTPVGNEKIIYLTFDDGPGVYTEKILEILAKYNVKATFFVTNQFTKYVPLIEKEHKEGHVVAVHTLTHKWDVYSSVDAYLNDFNQMNAIIEQYTGKKSKIFRFPGGSSNTVSKKYAKGVVSAIAAKMTEDGYVYFDWDVDSNDAGGGSEAQIYNNVVNGAANCSKCVVLMHDIKKNTVNQLDNILKTLTSKGYKFSTLSVDSPTVHMKISN